MSNIITWKEGKQTLQMELRALEQLELLDDEVNTSDKIRVFMKCGECGVINMFTSSNFDFGGNCCHHCGQDLEEIPLWEF